MPTATSVVHSGIQLVAPASRPESHPSLASQLTAEPPPPVSTTADSADHPAPPSGPHAAPAQPRESSGGGSGQRAPRTPFGPPGHSVSGVGSAAAPSAAAAGLLFAILLGFAAYRVQELRRHRLQFIVLAPSGFASPQQRPG